MTIAGPARRPTDAGCPWCYAPAGQPCHPRDADGVHTYDVQLRLSASHSSRYHAAGMICYNACAGCPDSFTEITYEDDDDDF